MEVTIEMKVRATINMPEGYETDDLYERAEEVWAHGEVVNLEEL